MKRYDVAVVGGGISGAVAGISSARNGSHTVLIEQYGFLGGMLTAAGVGPMMTFHAGDTQVIRGITGELVERLRDKGFSTGHLADTTGYTYTVTPFDIEGMKTELESMFLEAGGTLLFHTMLAGVEVTGKRVDRIVVCNKAGLSDLKASVYVDATGDADLSAWAGVECVKGRSADGKAQPMTMKLRMYGVDIPLVRRYIKDNPDEFPRLKGDTSIIDRAPRLSIGGFVNTFREARERGEINFSREEVLFFETNNEGEVIVNTSRITGLDATDPFDLTMGEVEGRKQAMELFRFLKKRVPGFADARLAFTGPAVGVRSSRQIEGLYRVTREDILRGTRFDDRVVCNAYPIDVHNPTGENTHSVHLERGAYYTIPYRSLVNARIGNLITVGRCISGEFEAQAAFRTTPGAGALGHAGGAAASLAAKLSVSFKDLDYRLVQELLRSQGAFLGD